MCVRGSCPGSWQGDRDGLCLERALTLAMETNRKREKCKGGIRRMEKETLEGGEQELQATQPLSRQDSFLIAVLTFQISCCML